MADPAVVRESIDRHLVELTTDDRIMIAMREARRHHLGWWLAELERHRGHRSFEPWSDARNLEYGFSCGCTGGQMHYSLRVHALKEMLPESRAMVIRMFNRAPGRGLPYVEMRARARVEKKARALLYRHLTREQKWSLRAKGSFTVVSGGRSYEIHRTGMCNNILTEWNGHTLSLCVVPGEGTFYPISDVMLYQKVTLETSPELLLDVAYVQDRTAGLIYESGRFLRDGSSPTEKSKARVVRVDVPDQVLDEPVEFMRGQMQDLTAVEVVSAEDVGLRASELDGITEVLVERVETRES